MVSGWQSSSQGHHSSSSSGVPRVAVKNSSRSVAASAATGPTSAPAASSRSRASRPASSGHVEHVVDHAGGGDEVGLRLAAAAQRSIWARSVVDCVCQANETGCRAGVGQPMRSQEQP